MYRSRLAGLAQDILNAGWEDSTRKTYERALRLDVSGTEEPVDMSLLPIDSTDKLMLVFAAMDGMAWSRIRVNKSAVRAWHHVNKVACVFDACWVSTALQFWRGLKKRAVHSSRSKRGVTLPELFSFIHARLGAGKRAGMRNAVIGSVAFFGIRRISEVLALRREDLHSGEGSVAI